MKTPKTLLILLSIFLFSWANAHEIRVMSFNIRYDNPGDGLNKWDLRKQTLCKQVLEYNPDFVGMQEVLKHQLNYMDSFLQIYASIGKGRDDGNEKGEYSPILYRKDKYYPLIQGQFWLNTQPDSIFKGWDAALPRICTWVKLKAFATGRIYYVFNTHFDHMGSVAREKSAALILQKINELASAGSEVILTGDFNMEANAPGITLLSNQLSNAASIVADWDKQGTFNGFNEKSEAIGPIDYIFYRSPALKPVEYKVIRDKATSHFASDHYAIFVRFKEDIHD